MAAGKEIKRLMGKEVTAEQLATLIGVGVDRFRKWLERDSDPRDTGDIQKVEQYFGVPLSGLAGLQKFDFVEKPTTALSELLNAPYLKSAFQVILKLASQHDKLIDQNGVLINSHASLVRQNEMLLGKFNLTETDGASHSSEEEEQGEQRPVHKRIVSDKSKKRSVVKVK